MFIQVRLLHGFQEPLLYQIPDEWPQKDLVGTIVRVPLQSRVATAIVVEHLAAKPNNIKFAIKMAESIEPFPQDATFKKFVLQLASYYQVHHVSFIKRIRQFVSQKEQPLEELAELGDAPVRHTNVTLTDEQQAVCDAIAPHIHTPAYTPTVLHGVTGSGKTEVYKQLILEAMNAGKTTILLLPEVSLALRFEKIMRAQLPPHIPVFSFHSGTGTKQKRLLWQHLLHQQPCLIVGVHIPILLPIANLGLILIDEAHDAGYQEKKHPKVNSCEAALMRAQLNNIPIILGSATPSISFLHNVKTRGWLLFQLKKRFAGAFPTVKTVMLNDKKLRRNFWISQQLEDEIRTRLRTKEQTIIFLNRRGFSFFMQCKSCSFIFNCPHCAVSLTLHETQQLLCHYCSFTMTRPHMCTSCKAPEKELITKGIGTQQVVSILEKLFPNARIGRADLDTSVKKNLLQKTIDAFQEGSLDILVGTQTITKGFHFPHVTLVGILWADINLSFPMYNASEITLQQLIQVAGRAGRQHEQSTVVVQAMGQHPIFDYLNEIDYLKFYEQEAHNRQELGYPPFNRFAEIEIKSTHEVGIDHEAKAIARLLMQVNVQHGYGVQILGPAKPPVEKIKHTFMRKIYLKGAQINAIIKLYQAIDHSMYTSHIFFTPNPLN